MKEISGKTPCKNNDRLQGNIRKNLLPEDIVYYYAKCNRKEFQNLFKWIIYANVVLYFPPNSEFQISVISG